MPCLRLCRVAAAVIAFLPAWMLAGGERCGPQASAGARGGDYVLLRVSVVDRVNRYVTGLEKKHFKVFEDGAAQTVDYFAHLSVPVCMAVVHDAQGSMAAVIPVARTAMERFLEKGERGDLFSLITFDSKMVQVENLPSQGSVVRTGVDSGRGPLHDALRQGIDAIRRCGSEKKALVLVGSLRDYEALEAALGLPAGSSEPDFQVFAIVRTNRPPDESSAVALSGGKTYSLTDSRESDYYLDLIHAELRNQYILGYSPARKVRDGKRRRISIKLDLPPGSPKLTVRAKPGYNAPAAARP